MVARAPTPEPSDEEPKYITVVHPYPLNAHMELPKDQRDFVLWLACCTGKDVLSAFFHKPSSPGMVIVEIDRNFDFKRVLGEHKWSKFLKTPTEEEADRTSRAYYCTLNTGRKVQKNGWKRVEVEEHWFAGWSPNNRFIVYPYPKTSYCELPKENQTNYPLCCQLPKNDFPRPPPALAPPVGSAQWHEAKANGTLPEGKPQPLSKTIGAWGKRAPKIAPRTATRPPPLAVPTPSASIISPVPSSRASTSSVWSRGLPALSRSGSANPSPALLTPSSADTGPAKFNWSDEVDRSEAESESVQFYMGPDAGYRSASRSVASRSSGNSAYADSEDDDDSAPRSIAHAMAEISFEAPKAPPSVQTWGVRDDYDDPWRPPSPSADGDNTEGAGAGAGADGASWAGYADPREDPKVAWECPEHGKVCKKGICQVYAKKNREERMKKEAEVREKEKKAKAEAREKKRRQREKEEQENAKAEDEWRAVGRRKGAGSSSPNSSGNGSNPARANAGDSAAPAAATEDWTNAGGAWTVGNDDDAKSVASTARKAWSTTSSSPDNDDGDDEDIDDSQSVASVRTSATNRTSATHSTRGEWSKSPTPWSQGGGGAWGDSAPPQRQGKFAVPERVAWGGARGGKRGGGAPAPTPRESQTAARGGKAAWGQPQKKAWDTQSTAGSMQSWGDPSEGPW